MCSELEDNSIHSLEYVKFYGVSHHHCPNNVADFYLQRDITHNTFCCIQACMMYMDQATPMDRTEEIAVIKSTIEVYYKKFKEIHEKNKRFENVAWGVFQKCKKSEDE